MLRGKTVEYTRWSWKDEDVQHLGVTTGVPKHQSFWEFLTAALALTTWGRNFRKAAVALLCDNSAAMQSSISLKGKGANLHIARELAWRQAQHGWRFQVGHLPKEANTWADALSRLDAPDGVSLPAELRQAREVQGPLVKDFWKLRDGPS